jgi:hypothetical protein
MSGARHTVPGMLHMEERFASNLDQALSAGLVAKRCAVVAQREARAAIWFAQWGSWSDGGLTRFLLGMRSALKLPQIEPDSVTDYVDGLRTMCLDRECAVDATTEEDSYGNPVSVFREDWTQLKSYRRQWISELPALTETSVSQRVFEALDYTQSARTLTVIDGPARIGKSFSAKSWCSRTGGLARYVQVPCSNDDAGFFRAIVRALGINGALELRASEMRNRVEDVVQKGDLMLVFDESQYCWPQLRQRCAWPLRVNWILQALVNFDVPVALVTTPLFYSSQKRVEELTGWTSEQLIGRIGHVERLPSRLSRADLERVARVMVPDGDEKTWGALAAYAAMSKKHLASIEAIAKRAFWLAGQNGEQSVTAAYVRRAMKESIVPSDTALSESLAPTPKARRNAYAKAPREARGYAAETGRSAPNVECPGPLIMEPRGGLLRA